MTPDHDRALQRRLTVYAAYETIDLIGGRIRQLVSTGRRMTYIHRKSDSEQMEVRTSLHMDTSEPDGGFQVWMAQDGKGIQITCSPDVVRWGCSGFLDDGAESEVQARFERGRPNSTRVQIQGFGDGRDDNIVITTLDEHGVWLCHDHRLRDRRCRRKAGPRGRNPRSPRRPGELVRRQPSKPGEPREGRSGASQRTHHPNKIWSASALGTCCLWSTKAPPPPGDAQAVLFFPWVPRGVKAIS